MAVWVLDVDGTIVDSLTGTSLRPGSAELLASLREVGVRTILWSAGGADYARLRATEHGIASLVDECHDKDGRDASGRYRTDHFLRSTRDVVFVDDRPEDLPTGAAVIAVAPYLSDNPHDRGLAEPLERARGLRGSLSGPSATARRGASASGAG